MNVTRQKGGNSKKYKNFDSLEPHSFCSSIFKINEGDDTIFRGKAPIAINLY